MTVTQDQQPFDEILNKAPRRDTTLGGALVHYQTVYMPSRNWAAKTRVDYANDITDLIRFLEGQQKTKPNDVSLNDLEAYLADRGERWRLHLLQVPATAGAEAMLGLDRSMAAWALHVIEAMPAGAAEISIGFNGCTTIGTMHRGPPLLPACLAMACEANQGDAEYRENEPMTDEVQATAGIPCIPIITRDGANQQGIEVGAGPQCLQSLAAGGLGCSPRRRQDACLGDHVALLVGSLQLGGDRLHVGHLGRAGLAAHQQRRAQSAAPRLAAETGHLVIVADRQFAVVVHGHQQAAHLFHQRGEDRRWWRCRAAFPWRRCAV